LRTEGKMIERIGGKGNREGGEGRMERRERGI
jgi:hypothetical protein